MTGSSGTTDRTAVAPGAVGPLDHDFTAVLQEDTSPGAWTYVVMPGSAEFFGTRRFVKVRGTIDGHPFENTLLAKGDGSHLMGVKAGLRRTIGKVGGDQVTIHLDERLK